MVANGLERDDQISVCPFVVGGDSYMFAAELNRFLESTGALCDLAEQAKRTALHVVHPVSLNVEPIALEAGQ